MSSELCGGHDFYLKSPFRPKLTSIQRKSHLILGSNMGNRMKHLSDAREKLNQLGTIVKSSRLYLTKSWGNIDQTDHLNQVIEFHTNLSASDLMDAILNIERDHGRKRTATWQPRVLDIDILFFDKEVHSTSFLTIPHCRISERNFVLVPLMEIAADLTHPTLAKTIEELYLSCKDNLEVLMLEDHG